jgi:signal transduction histidine kinase/FixJ family two-component response regulator
LAEEKILVVDDGQDTLQIIIEYVLKPNGYQYITAKNGEAGLQRALDEKPDLIIMDQRMQKMSGLEVLAALKEAKVDIPVILMTGYGSEETAVQAFRLGVKDYIIKPFATEEMASAIDGALEEQRLRRERDELTRQLVQTNRQLKRRVRELGALHGIGRSFTALLDLETVLERIVEVAIYITNAEAGALFFVDEESGELYLRVARNLDEDFACSLRIKVDDSIAGQVVKTGEPILLQAASDETRLKVETGYLVKALLYVPLKLRDKVIGVLSVDNRVADRPFTDNDLEFLYGLAGYVAVAIENARLYEELGLFAAELEQRVEQRTGELHRALRIQSEFLSTVSHELRSPLASIKWCLEGTLAGLYGDVTGKQRERFELALAKANEEAYLIENLLDLVRIESGQVSLDLEEEDLSRIVRDVVQEFERDAKDKGIELKVTLPPAPVPLVLDRQKVKQIVANLVSNAIKFTPGPGCVTISVSRRDNQVILQIADTGIGIPQGEMDKIFDRFYQVDRSLTREVGGTGIGLNIVKNYVELHEGKVTVESEVKGSIFTVLLPANLEAIVEEKEDNAPVQDVDS